ncbi:MAG: alpha/beta hydrolase family esterase, partial [Coprobacillaceae bacterium]
MKKVIILIVSIFLLSSTNIVNADETVLQEVESSIIEGYTYFQYNSSEEGYTSNRSDVLTPTYYIFAGEKNITSANAMIEELGILPNVREWAGSIYVINPIDGEYDVEDMVNFEELVKNEPIKNTKIIGIDDGATFVNNYLSQKCNYIAGIMLIGGEMETELINDTAVPTYLSNSTQTAIDFYKHTNDVNTTTEKEEYVLHTNSNNPFQRVVIAKSDETMTQAFSNAWESVFSNNYRYHNSEGEFYNLPILNGQKDILELEYDLVQTPIFDDLNMQYNEMIHQSVSNMPGSEYAWFEYIPNQVLNSEDNSIPLIITIHGNQNDPRLQGDTSGWAELAARENFMVVSPEYQTASENGYFTQPSNTNIYGIVDGLGADGIINLINDLQVKYPQIDASRIYVTGLSQGGAMTSLLGIKNSDVFATAASVSGVNVYGQQINEIT